MLKDAGLNCIRFLKCSDQTQWNAAKHFRQKYFFDQVPVADPYTWTFNHKKHQHFILYQGVEIIGYAHIQLWPEHRSAIRIIVIHENKRDQTFGGQFIALIEKWLKKQGRKSVHVESSPEALRFYKKQGYNPMPFDDPDAYESSPEDIPIGKLL